MIIAQTVNIIDEESQLVTAELTAKIRADWSLVGMYSNIHSSTMRKYYKDAIEFTDSVHVGKPYCESTASRYLETFAFRLYSALMDVCFDYDNHMHHVHADCMPTEQVARMSELLIDEFPEETQRKSLRINK